MVTFTLSNPSVYSTVVKLLPIEGDTDLDFMTAKVHYMCVCSVGWGGWGVQTWQHSVYSAVVRIVQRDTGLD